MKPAVTPVCWRCLDTVCEQCGLKSGFSKKQRNDKKQRPSVCFECLEKNKHQATAQAAVPQQQTDELDQKEQEQQVKPNKKSWSSLLVERPAYHPQTSQTSRLGPGEVQLLEDDTLARASSRFSLQHYRAQVNRERPGLHQRLILLDSCFNLESVIHKLVQCCAALAAFATNDHSRIPPGFFDHNHLLKSPSEQFQFVLDLFSNTITALEYDTKSCQDQLAKYEQTYAEHTQNTHHPASHGEHTLCLQRANRVLDDALRKNRTLDVLDVAQEHTAQLKDFLKQEEEQKAAKHEAAQFCYQHITKHLFDQVKLIRTQGFDDLLNIIQYRFKTLVDPPVFNPTRVFTPARAAHWQANIKEWMNLRVELKCLDTTKDLLMLTRLATSYWKAYSFLETCPEEISVHDVEQELSQIGLLPFRRFVMQGDFRDDDKSQVIDDEKDAAEKSSTSEGFATWKQWEEITTCWKQIGFSSRQWSNRVALCLNESQGRGIHCVDVDELEPQHANQKSSCTLDHKKILKGFAWSVLHPTHNLLQIKDQIASAGWQYELRLSPKVFVRARLLTPDKMPKMGKRPMAEDDFKEATGAIPLEITHVNLANKRVVPFPHAKLHPYIAIVPCQMSRRHHGRDYIKYILPEEHDLPHEKAWSGLWQFVKSNGARTVSTHEAKERNWTDDYSDQEDEDEWSTLDEDVW